MVVLKSEVIGIFYAWRRPRPPSPKCFRLWLRRGKGPWKGVLGAGRARRKESVIVVKKIDVHVHHFWGLGISGQPGQNKRPASENRRF